MPRIDDDTKNKRLDLVYRRLERHPDGLTEQEVSELCAMERRTANNYLRELEIAGRVYKDGRLWFPLPYERTRLRQIDLSPEEALTLYLAARLLVKQHDRRNESAELALVKLADALTGDARVGQEIYQAAEELAHRPGDAQHTDIFRTVVQAYIYRRRVRIRYNPLHSSAFTTVFSPYLLEPSAIGYATYVIGHSEMVHALRTYKLERIEEAALTSDEYTIPADFPGLEYLRSAWSIVAGERLIEVQVRFSPYVAPRVRESRWHPSQRIVDDPEHPGGCIWSAQIADEMDFIPWLRSWGSDAELLEPEELRDRMVQESRRLAALYRLAAIEPQPLYQRLWAKTSRDRKRTHPLIYHMLDVAQVVTALWDHSLPASTRGYLAGTMHMDQGPARRWLAFLAGLHDLGKACPAFQSMHDPSMLQLAEGGLTFPEQRVRVKTPHGWVSTLAARDLLAQQPGLDRFTARKMAQAIGGHHGLFPTAHELDQVGPSQRGDQGWEKMRRELFDHLAAQLGVSGLPPWPEGVDEIPTFWTLVSGLISFADWIGSIESYFFDLQASNLETYAGRAYRTAAQALEELGWTGWSPPAAGMDFRSLFDSYEPRPLQQAAIDVAGRLPAPALVIVEAPTGEGKTEAALYLADHWLCAGQQRGTYVAMPTQATSNQMLGRVRTFLEHRYTHGTLDLHLLHGNAGWSKEMEELRLAAVGDDAAGAVTAHGWFMQQKKRGLLAPFAVGTVDQALMSVLQTRHFFVRLFGLSHKTVILDEVHAYDTYMSVLLERLLQWLSAMETTVVILSATLPARTRQALFQAYTGRKLAQDAPYPALSWATGEGEGVVPLETSPLNRRTLHVDWIDREPQALVENLCAGLAGGGCGAVICNTVGRAQEVYRALCEAQLAPDEDLILFHARFPFNRRQEIEEAVLERFGKEGQRPGRAIVVATQVIEQSLDLDFDLMITDPAPIDLIVQRAGRLHRHRRESRPAGLAEPRLWITRPEIREEIPHWGNDGFVYEPYVLLRSYLALQQCTHIQVPGDVQSLIEQVYGPAEPEQAAPAIRSALAEARDKMEAGMRQERFQAHTCLIPGPDDETVLSGLNRDLDEDNPELHETWRAMTRLVRPSVTLICLHRQGDGVSLDAAGERTFSLDQAPGRDLGRELAQRTVNLSNYAVVRHFLAQEPPAGWSDHPALRYYRAALFEGGRCDCGENWLILDHRLGLLIERKEGV